MVGKIDDQLCMDPTSNLEEAVVRSKDRFYFRHLAELEVNPFNDVELAVQHTGISFSIDSRDT